jgi:hypothetical protein
LKRRGLVLILGVAGIALGVAAVFGPWWVDNYSTRRFTITTLFGLFGSLRNPDTTYATFTGWPSGSDTWMLFLVAGTLVAVGLASGVGMFASVAFSGRKPRLQRVGVALGFIASAFVLASALGVMLFLPAAVNRLLVEQGGWNYYTGFWGSISNLDHTPPAGYYPDVYGAGWAWYMLVAVGIIFLIAALMLFRAPRQSVVNTGPESEKQP